MLDSAVESARKEVSDATMNVYDAFNEVRRDITGLPSDLRRALVYLCAAIDAEGKACEERVKGET